MDLKLNKRGQPDGRAARRELHLAKLAAFIGKTPRTVQQCAKELGVTVRGVYWLFDALDERGHTVARVGPKAGGKYVLLGRTV